MKEKKLFINLGVLILGAVITATIDYLIGISFKDVGVVARITHTVIYMVWGGAIVIMGEWPYR